MTDYKIHDNRGPRNRLTLAWAVLRGRAVMTRLVIEAHHDRVLIKARPEAKGEPVASKCMFKSRGMFIDDDGLTLMSHDPDEESFGVIDARTDHT